MKILVLGAFGMAGHTVALYFKEQGYEVHAFARRPFPYCMWIQGDAFDIENLKTIVTTGRYDVVINCIGLLNQFAESAPEKAIYINSYLPHLIVSWLKDTSTRFIQMSTDCVFAGNTGPYDEESFPDGKSYYDRTKALGEVNDDKNLTFRNSIIGPDINENGIGLFHWFMQQNGSINGFTKAIWTGVTTLTLAKAMECAIRTDLSGLYNLVNNDSINKYDLLCLFNQYFRNNELTIKQSDKLVLDKTLLCKRTDFDFVVPSYEQMIIEMKEWVNNHKEIYPLY
ncbi:SDR family oxidoreductase [Bacteroides thetaiotaomicron]|jgi:putative reductase|uniref:dTDP-4-dehydrorhamnose reductase n=1 Tax=Bacteroides thetaiotaomicron TaxID=818 RepID=A0AAJ4U6E5_BACT4|nr:SDR family oxidoreductase [Bacteroides thetaiotaomicron]MDC2153846.1 SDR family oxidoreductase [Bacteroides thetaiotaomicron]MDC2219405.1 SDR family oxidoreductase [Bacteroides thetaiotaomicron]MDC2225100.1 SDR family oxidoreductase [Bacteroides thetaiotaomicron]MDC2239114.1 SDR family oxidoreductase [Bacteroides thetaiotaomicron]RGR93776.1 SDR family NAD(P)-dependent oxidoreductase [Bacteroides thetaiotaomicron]